MKRFSLIALSLSTVLLGLAPRLVAQCTLVGGNIINQTWTKDKSPYCVTNDVYVTGLTVRGGVRIVVQGDFVFEVGGRLRVLGTAAEPVEFLPENEEVGWQGLLFRDAVPGSSLNHTVIQGSKNSGLRITNTPPALTNCVIRNNISPRYGGGISANVSGNPFILQGCILSNNVTGPNLSGSQEVYGGGIVVVGRASLIDCLVISNRTKGTTGYGGGVFARGHCTMRNTRVVGNFPEGGASQYGDGIYFDVETIGSGMLDMANCLVSGNGVPGTAGAEGKAGGLWVYTGTALVRNCVIVDNAQYGIYQSHGLTDLINTTVTRNQWHGVVSQNAAARMTNCIVFSNYDGGPQVSPSNLRVGYSCIQGGYSGEGNISFTPSLCPATFSLLEGSPCIDAGHPGLEYRDGCVDINVCAEFARGTNRNDMGAFGGPWVCDWTDPSSAPKIRIQPITDVALEGELAAMDVLATGEEVLAYQWYRSADSTPIVGATNAVLSWTAVQFVDDSFVGGKTNNYFVEASNAAGTARSWPASLIVTSLEVAATLKTGTVELAIRRNKPIAQCEIRTAADPDRLVRGPWTVVATVDLTESLTTWRAPNLPVSSPQFYLAVPVQ